MWTSFMNIKLKILNGHNNKKIQIPVITVAQLEAKSR